MFPYLCIYLFQGANLMGLYGCALLNEAGFRKVYCHDISRERLRLVPKFGGVPVYVENSKFKCTFLYLLIDFKKLTILLACMHTCLKVSC